MKLTVQFPPSWINGSSMEDVLQACAGTHESVSSNIHFCFPAGCKIMIDAAVRLLSLFNQLDHCCRRVSIDFSTINTLVDSRLVQLFARRIAVVAALFATKNECYPWGHSAKLLEQLPNHRKCQT